MLGKIDFLQTLLWVKWSPGLSGFPARDGVQNGIFSFLDLQQGGFVMPLFTQAHVGMFSSLVLAEVHHLQNRAWNMLPRAPAALHPPLETNRKASALRFWNLKVTFATGHTLNTFFTIKTQTIFLSPIKAKPVPWGVSPLTHGVRC